MTEVFIYRTSVRTHAHVRQVDALFGTITSIKRWTFDLEDCDKILRVEANGLQPQTISGLLATAGIDCEPLEYEL